MDDAKFYLSAANELDGESRNEAVWTKSMTLCLGDEVQARYKYISIRVEQLITTDLIQSESSTQEAFDPAVERLPSVPVVTDDESHYVQPYIQVSEYAESHNLPIDHVIGLINDGKVAGQKRGNVWFVVNDEKSMGSAHAPSSCADLSLSHQLTANRKTTMTDNQNEIRTTSPTDKGFFAKLSSGDFGLAKTYWLYGVVVGTVSSFAMNLITSVGLLVPVLLAYTVYQVLVLMGTWRASSKYQGWKVWAVLAKIAVVLGVVMMFVTLATILTLLG